MRYASYLGNIFPITGLAYLIAVLFVTQFIANGVYTKCQETAIGLTSLSGSGRYMARPIERTCLGNDKQFYSHVGVLVVDQEVGPLHPIVWNNEYVFGYQASLREVTISWRDSDTLIVHYAYCSDFPLSRRQSAYMMGSWHGLRVVDDRICEST